MGYEFEQVNREQSVSETDSFTERRYRQFARHLGAGFAGQVLDVGCNTGRGGLVFARSAPGAELDGVELVPDRVERIPAGVYRTVYRGLLEGMPAGSGPYDALLMGEVVEHVTFGGFEGVIDRSIGLLAPGGRMLLTTLNPHYLRLRLRPGGSVLGGAHVSLHCPVALRQFLTWKGLTVETVTGSGRVSGLVGEKLPLACYGSYLLMARKQREM